MSLGVAMAVLCSSVTEQWTCAPGSPESSLPFCQRKLGFNARANDLMSRLNTTEKIKLWGNSYPSSPYIERFNMKQWSLDHTCIHGLNKEVDVTIFAHAIAQGASFDRDLVARISNATAIEARILAYKNYARTSGSNQASTLSCDGGPLANSAHDPRWGRISETYGEDPYVIQQIGVTAMRSLQNQIPVPGSPDEDYFMATRQVTRHYLGYHQASPDLGPFSAIMNLTQRSLADSYLPTYATYQRPEQGNADGIMCAETLVNGIPSCVSQVMLKDLLRNEWKSDALIQTDCCDSVSKINNPFHWNGITTDYEAVQVTVNAGVQVYYGYKGHEYMADLADMLQNGTVSMDTLNSAAARVIKSQMKLGLFDTYSEDFPFRNETLDWSLLNSKKHRDLARESAAKSTVLLKNDGDFLPISPGSFNNVAVIGPFANCTTCMLHSYTGTPSAFTTIFEGIANRTHATYSLGSNASCAKVTDNSCWKSPGIEADAIQEAVSVAKEADLTILVIGLGAKWEAEGHDRVNMTLPGIQQALQDAVTAVSKKLVIVLMSAGGVDVDESKASSLVYAPYGGEEGGSGLADVLFGDVNPSAKLPVTFYKQSWADVMNSNISTTIPFFDLELGLGRTHRYVTPDSVKYGFGFGLSYTTFQYSALQIVKKSAGGVAATVSFTIKNTGSRDGADIAQVYASVPKVSGVVTPTKNLVAFDKIVLKANEEKTISFDVLQTSMETALNDGTRQLTSSSYTITVGGNQPGATGSSGPTISGTVNL